MAEAKMFTFTYQELAEMMVRKLDLSEGLWGIYMKFGLQATNVGPGPEELRPAAILPVLEVGLQRVDDPSNLAVDAAEVVKSRRKESAAARSSVEPLPGEETAGSTRSSHRGPPTGPLVSRESGR